MIREIVKDHFLLSCLCQEATKEDLWIGEDLLDTMIKYSDRSVGLAANMIGQLKRIIIFKEGDTYSLMLNPVIMKQSGQYSSEEGCLSHPGSKKTIRYDKIKVEYRNNKFEKRMKTYTGLTAQIIQHEIDHLNGILI